MTRISASEAFVETLVAQGVTHVFGVVGSAYMDALDLFEPAGIRFVSVAHEQNAAHMADGYSRVTGRHGVCIGQNGPGITNFVTAIAAAYWAHSPVVAITPECGSAGVGLGGFQETDQLPIFSRITKYQAHVNRPDRIAELTGRAFEAQIAVGDRRDIADIRADHGVRRQRLFQFAQRAARTDWGTVGSGQAVKLRRPFRLAVGHFRQTCIARRCGGQGLVAQSLDQRLGGQARVGVQSDRHRLDQPDGALVGVHLDHLGPGRPVIDALLRQRAERPEPAAQRQHDVGLRQHLHRRL